MERSVKFVWPLVCAVSVIVADDFQEDHVSENRKAWETGSSSHKETHSYEDESQQSYRSNASNAQDISQGSMLDGWQFGAYGSFLYYYATQEHMLVSDLKEMSFKWKPAFTLSAFCVSPADRDPWDFVISYLQYDSSITQVEPAGDSRWVQFEIAEPAGSGVTGSTNVWSLDVKWADFEVGKRFRASTLSAYRPFFGLKAIWTDQSMNVDFTLNQTPPEPGSTFVNSSSWGLGLQGGCNMYWGLPYDFKFYANTSMALPFTRFTEIRSVSRLDTPGVILEFQTGLDSMMPIFSFETGLVWEMDVMEQAQMAVFIGYDMHALFNANQICNIEDSTINSLSHPIGNLYLQGLNVGLGFIY